MLDDVTEPSTHLHKYPILLTSSCIQHMKLSTKGRNVSKYRNENATWVSTIQPRLPLPPLPPRTTVEFACTFVRGLRMLFDCSQH